MTLEAIWFGSMERPLAGYLHVPDREITGGVLICPPFGYEATCAHRSLRRLAERLTANGDLVLRFHYEGTGSSAGSGREPHLLERWQASVRCGIAELRARGVEHPALVGMRLGAALAAVAAGEDKGTGPVVLWAPISSGARYYRELKALSATNSWTAMDDGSLNVAGHAVPITMGEQLRAWKPLQQLDPDAGLLLVQSPGWRDAALAAAELEAAGVHPTVVEVAGTAEVLERDAEMVSPPLELLEAIAGWLSTRPREDSAALPSFAAVDDPVRVFDARDGQVREQILKVGPAGLHAVVTEPVERTARHGVVFLNNGVETADGPAEAWVEFARSLVARDVASLRVDLSGLGNSPDLTTPRGGLDNPTSRTSAAESVSAVEFLRGRGVTAVTVVGLCSGAQIAVRTAAYRGDANSVVAINAPLGSLRDLGVGPWMRRVWSWLALLTEKRPSRELMNRMPQGLWTMLDRLGLFPSPDRYLRRAAARNCRVRLVYAVGDNGLADLQSRAGRRLRRLVAADRVDLQVIEGMDHSLFNTESRRVAFEIVQRTALGLDSAAG